MAKTATSRHKLVTQIDKTAKHNLSFVDHRDEYLTMLLYVRQHKVKSSNCSVVNMYIK